MADLSNRLCDGISPTCQSLDYAGEVGGGGRICTDRLGRFPGPQAASCHPVECREAPSGAFLSLGSGVNAELSRGCVHEAELAARSRRDRLDDAFACQVVALVPADVEEGPADIRDRRDGRERPV